MANWLQITIAVLSSSALTAIVSAILNRRKDDVELDDKINQMAARLLDEQRGEIDRLRNQLRSVMADLDRYRKENEAYRRENEDLKAKIERLERIERGGLGRGLR